MHKKVIYYTENTNPITGITKTYELHPLLASEAYLEWEILHSEGEKIYCLWLQLEM